MADLILQAQPAAPIDGQHPQSQKGRILDHLQKIGPITPLEALDLYGCFRLAARIAELKRDGWSITSKKVSNKHGVTFAEYRLSGGVK